VAASTQKSSSNLSLRMSQRDNGRRMKGGIVRALAYTWFAIAAFFTALMVRSIVAGDGAPLEGWLLIAVPAGIGVVFMALAPHFVSVVPPPIRVVAFLTGIIVLMVGLAWAVFIDEYGAGSNFEMTQVGDTATVYSIDEQAQQRTFVFSGPVGEAEAYIAVNSEAEQSMTLPYVTAGIGTIVTLGSLGLGWRRTVSYDTVDA
jgi:hypothetical protein